MVNLIVTGCKRDETGVWQQTSIAQSEFDLAHLLRESARLGYTGAVTWVPFLNEQNPQTSLADEWAAWQDFVRRARAPRR